MPDNTPREAPKAPMPNGPAPIRVQFLIFSEAIDLPGRTGAQSVHHQMEQANAWRYDIQYYPHLRHHRVEAWKPAEQKSMVRMVHESKVKAWEPLS